MASVNKVILIGNLGKDPEVRAVGSTTVCNFSIATTEKWKDKDGNAQERTEWHNITFWGKSGETIAKYLHKGDPIYLEGHIQTDKYEKDGETRYATKIIGERFQFLGKSGSDKPKENFDNVHTPEAQSKGDSLPF